MKRMERRREIETRKKRSRIKWFLLLAFLVSTGIFYHWGPGLIHYFMQNRELPPLSPVVFDGEQLQLNVFHENGVDYVPVEWVQQEWLLEMEIIETLELARWTPSPEQIRFETSEGTERVNRTSLPLEIPLVAKGEDLFFPLSHAKTLLGVNTHRHPETGVLIVDNAGRYQSLGNTKEPVALIVNPETFSPVIEKLDADETVRIIETQESHHYVMTDAGRFGYLPRDKVAGIQRTIIQPESKELLYASAGELSKPFGLVWDYVGNQHPERSGENPIGALTVFSPTWFELRNAEGFLDNRGCFAYAEVMQMKGYQLWGLVTNAFDPDMTEAFMENEEGRKRFIGQLLVYASLYGLDGINIDFENIHYRNQDLFTGFVRELSEALHAHGLVVSIDVTIPGGSLNWSQVYDRESIEPHVDYFAVMTYDEHWGSSPVAGSVASIPWVRKGIRETMEVVPPEKILLGLPLYTRLWEESTGSDGSVAVSSRAMGMQFIRRILEENGVQEEDWVWDDSAGQYYAEYEAEGNRYRVWLEDERSLALKTDLIGEFGLAGFAAWRKDFEIPEVWNMLEQQLQNATEQAYQ